MLLTEILRMLEARANILDKQGKYTEADCLTKTMVKLASGSCLECGHDGSVRPVSKFRLFDKSNNQTSTEALCTRCVNKAKKHGFKITDLQEVVAAPDPAEVAARQQLYDAHREVQQGKKDYWNPAVPSMDAPKPQKTWYGEDYDGEDDGVWTNGQPHPDGRINDPRFREWHRT